ncbi:polysaccharide biosynthesis tyrosine autokinase [Paraferrimonas haliotis]|uniref:Tyrosine protein kinase n=1 Tax=Paraferrimonas haliotis TaxID=2013866 RepID=A0AA37TWG1_9GAMM|nr:polysaccharide biosynthesis tyrosine autokinase [Paraferrimonas haliotis]GLS82871.1 tyrosine protein kinase [Paraferrimonas haliotis]
MTATNNSNKVNQTDPDVIDLGKLLGLLIDGRWTIIITTAIFAAIAVFYAITATPVYKADALIQVEDKKGGLPGLGELGDMFASDSSGATEIELIKSRNILGKAVDDLNLTIKAEPKVWPIIGKYLERRKQVPSFAANSASTDNAEQARVIKVAKLEVPNFLLGEPLQLIYQGNNQFKLYHDDILILSGSTHELLKSGDGSVSILVTDISGVAGSEFSITKNARIAAIRSLLDNLSVSERGKQSGILSLALEGTDRQLTLATLNSVAKHYVLQNVQRTSAQAQQSLDFLKKQLPELKQKLDASEDALNDYRLANQSVDLSLETQSMLQQMVDLESRISELAFSEADIARRFTPEHPNYIAFKRKQKELLEERDRLADQTHALPKTQQEVLRLTRDVEVNQQIYLALLNNVQELNVAKAGTVGNVRLIDTAELAEFPVKPKKPLIAVLGTMLGGMLSVAFVLLRAAFNRGVTNPEELEEIGLNVYASIPYSESFGKRFKASKRKNAKPQSLLLAHYDPTDLAIEAIRSLRTSLHFAMMDATNNVIMLSGPSPEIGKSFVSANLATSLAQSGQKVLIVDADLRKGYMQKLFGLTWDDGLSDLLCGDLSLDKVIKKTEVEGLDFISRGQVPPNPAELLMHKNFTEFMETVSKQYDIVLIDTPPILAVTDAGIVGKHCGTNLLVTRFGVNPIKQIEVTARRFEQSGVEIKGVIFNGVIKTAAGKGDEYGYYSYEYK